MERHRQFMKYVRDGTVGRGSRWAHSLPSERLGDRGARPILDPTTVSMHMRLLERVAELNGGSAGVKELIENRLTELRAQCSAFLTVREQIGSKALIV